MPTGAITEYVDVAQVVLYVFWIFFAGLIFYLRREDKREGYPMESDRRGRGRVEGFPKMPSPKSFALPDGGTYYAPHEETDDRPIQARPIAAWSGAPLEPIGDPMLSEVGPGAYAMRNDRPELTVEGEPRIVPMRVASDYRVESRDPDPRGMDVVGADGAVAGRVSDVWVDLAESQVRYLEVELAGEGEGVGRPVAASVSEVRVDTPESQVRYLEVDVAIDAAGAGRHVLLPIAMSTFDRRRGRVKVASILARQFAQVPALAQGEQVTQLEEDKICAYYASGHLYAVPARRESLL